jgi:hypothetical protein
MIQITIHNDDPSDLYVSVTDLNQAGGRPVLSDERLNAGGSKSISIQEDGAGIGSIKWAAVRADDATVSKFGETKPAANDTVDVDVFGS